MKYKKIILILPYVLILIITPFYNILDRNYFIEIFGCGCVPLTKTNMLNIDFNANDLRAVIYLVILLSMIILGLFLSKYLKNKKLKVVYLGTIILWNVFLALEICKVYVWK